MVSVLHLIVLTSSRILSPLSLIEVSEHPPETNNHILKQTSIYYSHHFNKRLQLSNPYWIDVMKLHTFLPSSGAVGFGATSNLLYLGQYVVWLSATFISTFNRSTNHDCSTCSFFSFNSKTNEVNMVQFWTASLFLGSILSFIMNANH